MTKRLFLLGGGGHCKVVADIARRCGFQILGAVDRDPKKLGTKAEPGGTKVTWLQDDFLDYLRTHNKLPQDASVAISIGHNATRIKCMDFFLPKHLPKLIDPSAQVSTSAKIGPGTVILPMAVVNAASQLGRGVIVNTGAVVEHDCVIGNGVHISPNATLCGGVRVGALSWMGAGSVSIPLVSIGKNTIVGAGAVVIRDLPDDCTVVGNPARIIKAH